MQYFVTIAVTVLQVVFVASNAQVHVHTVMVFGRFLVCRNGREGLSVLWQSRVSLCILLI